ncbi:MAG: hypothetical protein ACR2QR_00895 [Woeseiaceae bacterium]
MKTLIKMAPDIRAPVLFLCLVATAWPVQAEPYLAVYKGMQCSSCHSHPAGGGLRNAYGNVFAQTELPAERVGSADAALWTGQVFDWLSVGADLRAEYRTVDTPETESTSEFDISRGTVYLEAKIIPNRLSVYLDQQVAPGSSLNREAYIRINSRDQRFHFAAGQFFLPFGLRLQDDTAFIREVTGINFTIPDRGIQAGFEAGPWSAQLAVTNGSGGGSEIDTGKQISVVASYVRPRWRLGVSTNSNNADVGDREMQGVFLGLKTGPVIWLAEADIISDDVSSGSERDAIAGLVEANWLIRTGHNLKISYDYFDPDDDVSEDHQVRYSLVWEFTPMQFLQGRFGTRIYDGIPQISRQNRDEFFAELHGFF